MTRLYSNENFPLTTVQELRKLGHDVLTSFDAGNAGAKIADPEVLAFAISSQRVLLTLNRRHFIRLHNESDAHSGIIVCTFNPNFTALAKRIDDALKTNVETKGKLIRINRQGA